MGDFRMPSLGADMDEGAIIEWRVSPGDPVRRGQTIAVVDTAKAAIDIEAFEDGVLEEILVGPGVTVPVGTALARIAAGAAAPEGKPPETPPLPAAPEVAGRPAAALRQIAAEPGPATGRIRATPRARRLAAENGLDLGVVRGTGAAGAVMGADVERMAAGSGAIGVAPGGEVSPESQRPAAAGAAGRAEQPLPTRTSEERKGQMRAAIASLMSRSAAEIPHYYVTSTMDVSTALDWLRRHNAELPAQQRVLRAALFLRATVIAARKVPDLNGQWIDGALHRADQVDLGVAVATRGGGLVTPAIPDAGGLLIDELMARLADLVRRVRGGALRQSEMSGATITVSSLGESGPDALYGVIFPPQVALVGLGGVIDRAWAVNGMLAVRPTITATLAADHRASDGRTAAAFLAAFANALDHPEEL